MRIPRKPTVEPILKFIAAVVSTVAVAYLSLSHTDIIKANERAQLLAIIAIAVISMGVSLRATFYELTEPKRVRSDAFIRGALEVALFTIQDEVAIEVRQLAVALYLVKRRRGSLHDKHLERVMGVSFASNRSRSRVDWTKGKGVIGLCWQSERYQCKDLSPIFRRWGTCGRDQWEQQVPAATRMGLSFEDWERTRGKYGSIVAVPVQEGDRFIGCLAVDAPEGKHTELCKREVREALEAAAASIPKLST